MKAPELSISIMIQNSVEVVDQVANGKADIGLVYDVAVDADSLDAVTIHHETITAVAHASEQFPMTSTARRLNAFP
ncbi:MAG: hypothetical protein DI587_39195 [Variovorax paradoxus]|nr:MAG: hypothetical protein DI583_39195 [Variovorax paradoxus]PZP98876.1 MAG: hypothetical protein DI587_39195 [Variovorax paradoxus]